MFKKRIVFVGVLAILGSLLTACADESKGVKKEQTISYEKGYRAGGDSYDVMNR